MAALAESASQFSRAGSDPKSLAAAIASGVCGPLLLIGLWTPAAGAAFAVVKLIVPAYGAGATWETIYPVTMAVAVALVGPGALSVDCRLYGPREIVIPPPEKRT